MRKASEVSGRDKVSLWWSILAGGCAGIMNWIIGMPADVLKSRLQTGKIYYTKFNNDEVRVLAFWYSKGNPQQLKKLLK